MWDLSMWDVYAKKRKYDSLLKAEEVCIGGFRLPPIGHSDNENTPKKRERTGHLLCKVFHLRALVALTVRQAGVDASIGC